MYALVITTVLYGVSFTGNAGSFATSELCDAAARQMSGPNWVMSCRTGDVSVVGPVIMLNKFITDSSATYSCDRGDSNLTCYPNQ